MAEGKYLEIRKDSERIYKRKIVRKVKSTAKNISL
jgi:hypothetical protein